MRENVREVYLSLFTDFGFKKIFGVESNSTILIDFLNTVLELDTKIVEIAYINTEILGLSENDRKSIFDIHCKDENGNIFIIEIQRLKETFFKDRSIYYSMFPISSQAKKGNWNYRLKQTYTICIMDFCFDDTHPDHMLHEVKLIETKTHKVFSDRLMFWYLEMPKFKKREHELITRKDKWFFIINNLHTLKEIPLSLADDPIFKQVFMDAETAKLMEAELHAYIASRKAQWDEYAVKETAREEGKIEGKADAILEIARAMKSRKEPVQKIIEYTGLSGTDIEML